MMKLDEYILARVLGKGTFGEVLLTQKVNDSINFYATKKMKKELVEDPRYTKYFNNEISILRKLKHENIIRLENLKVTKNNYYIIMEFCNGGSLSQCLNKYKEIYHRPFTEEIVQHLMKQIINAVKYIHSQGIIHRDLKLDNILVKFFNKNDYDSVNLLNAQIKIIDFGFATYKNSGNLARTAMGSPLNMDPLILKKFTNGRVEANDLYYDEKADIWSIGALCYQMLIGNSPFDAYNMKELLEKIEEGNYQVPTNLSKEVVSFLNGMLQYDPNKRLTAENLSKHDFLNKSVAEFSRINTNMISGKIYGGQLNINIKNNQSIWAIFNEENQKTFDNIPMNYFSKETPIKEIQSQYIPNLDNPSGISPEPYNEDKKFINDNFISSNSTPILDNKQPIFNLANGQIPINEKSYLTQNSSQNISDEIFHSFSSKPNNYSNQQNMNNNIKSQIMNDQLPKKESIMTVKDGLYMEDNIIINNGQYQNNQIVNQNNNMISPQQINNPVNNGNQYFANQIPFMKVNQNHKNLSVTNPQKIPIVYNNNLSMANPQNILIANPQNKLMVNPKNISVANPQSTPIINPQNMQMIPQNPNQINLQPIQYIKKVPPNIINPQNNKIVQKKIYINPQQNNPSPSPRYIQNQPREIQIIQKNPPQTPNKLIQQQKDYPSSTAPHNKPPYKQNQIQQMSPIANKFIRRNVITPSKAIKNINITTPNKNHKLIRIIRPQMQRENRHINRIKSDGNLGPKIYGIQNYPQQNKVVIKLPVRRISNNQIVPANFQSGINKKNYAINTPQKRVIVQNTNVIRSPHPNIVYKKNVD